MIEECVREMMIEYTFNLYIMGKTPKSLKAVKNLQEICDKELNGRCSLEVTDIKDNPQIAEDERILTTPILIKKHPQPICRFFGDFAHKEKILTELNIQLNK